MKLAAPSNTNLPAKAQPSSVCVIPRYKGTGQRQANAQNTRLAHDALLDIYADPTSIRKTSIICTIGPKTNTVEKLRALAQAGMNIVRLNFSHGSYEYHQSVIDNTRAAEATLEQDTILSIALDTKGPEIRTGVLEGNPNEDIQLNAGDEITVSVNKDYFGKCSKNLIFVDYERLPKVVGPGSQIFIDDGLICLNVVSTDGTEVKCKIVNSGKLGSQKGVNLPNAQVDLPALSEKDKKDLEFGVKNNVDMIFASFIRTAKDVHDIRETLGEQGKNVLIISKIENHQGVQNFDSILEATDGVMVARGDLGIEIPPEKVFLAQKMMIAKCNIAGKPIICATQMLESMTFNPRPTRAECTDVANAVLDGADCVMLSGETAKGIYPIETVSMMHRICREAEAAMFYGPLFNELRLHTPSPISTTETVACAAVTAAFEHEAGCIIVLTTTGGSAQLVAKYRPAAPIIAVTRYPETARRCHLYRGVHPVLTKQDSKVDSNETWQLDVDTRIQTAMHFAKRKGFVREGDSVVCIQGWQGGPGNTNTLRILIVP